MTNKGNLYYLGYDESEGSYFWTLEGYAHRFPTYKMAKDILQISPGKMHVTTVGARPLTIVRTAVIAVNMFVTYGEFMIHDSWENQNEQDS